MESERIPVQEMVKNACSISYVSEKLGVSRPTLYKYMELYDAGETSKIPPKARSFLSYVTESRRSEEDVILYFIKKDSEPEEPEPSPTIETRLLSEPGRVMIMFPGANPEDVVVRILVDFGGERRQIAEYRPDPGTMFVTIDRLVSGQTFYYEVASPGTGRSSGIVPFEIQK